MRIVGLVFAAMTLAAAQTPSFATDWCDANDQTAVKSTDGVKRLLNQLKLDTDFTQCRNMVELEPFTKNTVEFTTKQKQKHIVGIQGLPLFISSSDNRGSGISCVVQWKEAKQFTIEDMSVCNKFMSNAYDAKKPTVSQLVCKGEKQDFNRRPIYIDCNNAGDISEKLKAGWQELRNNKMPEVIENLCWEAMNKFNENFNTYEKAGGKYNPFSDYGRAYIAKCNRGLINLREADFLRRK